MEKPSEVGKDFLKELSNFFEVYHEKEGNEFKVLKIAEAEEAIRLIKENLHYEGD